MSDEEDYEFDLTSQEKYEAIIEGVKEAILEILDKHKTFSLKKLKECISIAAERAIFKILIRLLVKNEPEFWNMIKEGITKGTKKCYRVIKEKENE